jgi:hypothetical protein
MRVSASGSPSLEGKGYGCLIRFPFPLGKRLGVRFFGSLAMLASSA